MTTPLRFLPVLALLLFAPALHAQTVYFVDADATGANTGLSWSDALVDLQSALALAQDGDEVWVAEGVYRPGTTRSATFSLRDGVRLFGGFAGTETQRHERNWATNETILSGDLGVPGQASDNSYHVVSAQDVGATTVLDGFTIRNGNADGAGTESQGGGLRLDNAPIRVAHCSFHLNQSTGPGSALVIRGAAPHAISNVAFIGNSSSQDGTIALDANSRTVFTSLTLTGNLGGGLYATGNSRPELNNAIVWDNPGGAAISTVDGALAIVRHAVIEGGYTGTSILDSDPFFARPPGTQSPSDLGDLRLLEGSPAIDSGLLALLPLDLYDDDGDSNTAEAIPFDLAHAVRVQDGGLNLGAFEMVINNNPPPPDCPSGGVVRVKPDGPAGGNGETWATAVPQLRDALPLARACSVPEVWVAAGTYTPTDDLERDSSFVLFEGLALLGGFSGTETSADQANPVTNRTILSGELAAPPLDDNSYHVLRAQYVEDVLLDGFIITRGSATESSGGNPRSRGGGLYAVGSTLTVRRCTFFDNEARYGGGGLYASSTRLHVVASAFRTNRSAFRGGGIFSDGPVPVRVETSHFEANHAEDGAGIYADQDGSRLYVASTAFHQNMAFDTASTQSGIGGGIAAVGDSLVVEASTFIANSAETGGGIWTSARKVFVSETQFEENTLLTSGQGGGLYCLDAVPCSITDSQFLNNTASSGGGASCQNARCEFDTVTMEGNTASSDGGGLQIFRALSGSIIRHYTATGNQAYRGGGLSYEAPDGIAPPPSNPNVFFEGLYLTDNTGTFGGGMYTFACGTLPLRLYNLHAAGNTAQDGGGLYATGGDRRVSGPLIKDCFGDTQLSNALFVDNVATEQGGAIFLSNRHVFGFTMAQATLAGNTAAEGGGLYNADTYASVHNSIVWANSGGSWAGDGLSFDHAIVADYQKPNPTVSTDDPRFVRAPFTNGGADRGDLHLQPDSPAIDAGDASALPPDFPDLDGDGNTEEPLSLDLDDSPRIVRLRPDLGPYEDQMGVAIEPPSGAVMPFALHGAIPNPVSVSSRILFDLPQDGEVTLVLYDVLGRALAVRGPRSYVAGGNHRLALDTRSLPSGVYVYRLTVVSEGRTRTASGTLTVRR